MNCPQCNSSALQQQEIESNLQSLQCPQCEGQWIKSFQYWRWREQLGSEAPEINNPAAAVTESGAPKLCPECSYILIPHRVGHGVDFSLDRCGNCGGIWFERNEWETLRGRNLHTDVHKMFNAVWQREVFEASQAEARAKRLAAILGTDDFAEIQRVKGWIESHQQRGVLYAFLTQERT